MTTITRNPAVAEYYHLRDSYLAAGGTVPPIVFHWALACQHGRAVQRLRELIAARRQVVRGPGRFAAEVAEPTTGNLAETRNRALAHLATELHEAGPEQLRHLACMAEACCSTDLGQRMRGLVDDERSHRVFGLVPQPSRPALGFDWWATRQERWEQAGQVGDPSDPEYDDFLYQGRHSGEGGSR